MDIPSRDTACVPVPWSARSPLAYATSPIGSSRTPSCCPGSSSATGTLFPLRVHGKSMINAAITDGDLVVVRQQERAENGDIVAVMIDGEATVKTFRRAKRPGLADAAQSR